MVDSLLLFKADELSFKQRILVINRYDKIGCYGLIATIRKLSINLWDCFLCTKLSRLLKSNLAKRVYLDYWEEDMTALYSQTYRSCTAKKEFVNLIIEKPNERAMTKTYMYFVKFPTCLWGGILFRGIIWLLLHQVYTLRFNWWREWKILTNFLSQLVCI